MSLSEAQIRTIVATERAASILSLIGAAFVVVTFTLDSKFRKPINRLVFYATWGNIMSNVATLISTSGILAGEGSGLCQLQAFLIQWFMPADALWTFSMACNVYLSFFRSYDSASLRSLEPKYIAACYGVPLVPALTFLFVHSVKRGRVYGSAVLWCWVSLKWDFLRVAVFYGPVWIVILLTITIYFKVGIVVLKWRHHLLSMRTHPSAPDRRDGPILGICRTYEVSVTSTNDIVTQHQKLGFPGRKISFHEYADPRTKSQPTFSNVQRSGGIDPNKATLKYCKCALLFFVALFITWVPSTINRIYTLFRPDDVVFGLNFAAALVLPLQGFWNAVVYTATSVFAVKSLLRDIHEYFGYSSAVSPAFVMHRQRLSQRKCQVRERATNPQFCNYEADRSSSQSDLSSDLK